YLVVEGPVFVGAATGQLTHNLGGFQVDGNVFGAALAYRNTDLGGILGDIKCCAFDLFLRFAHNQLAKHACRLVTGQRAQIFKRAVLVGAEHYGGCRAFSGNVVGLGAELGYGDIVNGAIAIDDVNLHNGIFRHLQVRIDLPIDGARIAHEYQLAVCDVGTQGKGDVGRISDRAVRRLAVMGRKRWGNKPQ